MKRLIPNIKTVIETVVKAFIILVVTGLVVSGLYAMGKEIMVAF